VLPGWSGRRRHVDDRYGLFAQIHATAKGYSQDDVALLLSHGRSARLILQIPLVVSDSTAGAMCWRERSARKHCSVLARLSTEARLMALVVISLIWDAHGIDL